MRGRLKLAVSILAATYLAILVVGGGFNAVELLVTGAVLVFSGVGPFAFGIAVSLLWKQGTVPFPVSVVFGVALGILRFAVPQLGGFEIMDSRFLAALVTAVLGVAFAELGIACAMAISRRRQAKDGSTPEA